MLFLEWAKKQGNSVYEIGSAEWQAFLGDLFSWEAARRKELMQNARKQGAAAFEACIAAFEPIVILIDDLEACLEKSEQSAQMYAPLRYNCQDNVSGFGIYCDDGGTEDLRREGRTGAAGGDIQYSPGGIRASDGSIAGKRGENPGEIPD